MKCRATDNETGIIIDIHVYRQTRRHYCYYHNGIQQLLFPELIIIFE